MLISRDSNFAAGMLMVLALIFLIIFGAPGIVFHEDVRTPSLVFFILFSFISGSMLVGLFTPDDHTLSKRNATILLFVSAFVGVLVEHAMHEEWIGRELRRIKRNKKNIQQEIVEIKTFCTEKSAALKKMKKSFITKWIVKRRITKQARRGLFLIKKLSTMKEDAFTSDTVPKDYRETYTFFLKILEKK